MPQSISLARVPVSICGLSLGNVLVQLVFNSIYVAHAMMVMILTSVS
jgi:hypothetical protein